MIEINHPPDAPSLLESMRSIGYSLESALADIVDNSISARAGNIAIEFRPEPVPYIAILDDGCGMSQQELERAMRHGSTNPSLVRDEHDLGRYGLGLKTASLSQCRRLTVISLNSGKLSGYCWDLDRVLLRQAWTLLKLDRKEILTFPHVDQLLKQESGTIVLWHELDRLLAGETMIEKALGHQMVVTGEHLSLRELRDLFDEEYADTGVTWEAIQPALAAAILPIMVRSVNQKSGAASLSYAEYAQDGLRVIAIGGNSLARGLTLEGLCISYFYRSTAMYDTLLQMGRWFGYRSNYEDLVRIWMSDETANWYSNQQCLSYEVLQAIDPTYLIEPFSPG